MPPALAVAICTRNRPDALADVLADVAREAPGDVEVLVVDQSDVPVPTPGARVVRDLGRGLPRARTLAVHATTAPWILFLDDDVRLHPGFFAGLAPALADPRNGGVQGRIIEAHARPNAPAVTNRVGPGGRVRTNLDGDGAEVATLKGACMALRRAAIAGAGLPDPGFDGSAFLEDADWSTRVRRAGWRLAFAPAAVVTHLAAPTGGCRVDDAERARFRNTGRFVRKHRPWTLPLVAPTFAAIAVKRAVEARDPRRVPALLGALAAGWRSR